MKLYTCYSPSHEVLFREHFLPTVKLSGLELQPCFMNIAQWSETGAYGSPGFTAACRQKWDMLTSLVSLVWYMNQEEERVPELLVYSDVDVRFYGAVVEDLEAQMRETGADLLCQWDGDRGGYCTGFMVLRPTRDLYMAFASVGIQMSLHRELEDQQALNRVLSTHPIPGIEVGALPARYWTFGRTNNLWTPGTPVCPPDDLLVHHANWTVGIENKIALLKAVENETTKRKVVRALNHAPTCVEDYTAQVVMSDKEVAYRYGGHEAKFPNTSPEQILDDINQFIDQVGGLRDGEPCGHPGCLSHVSHPCENCGRVAGRRVKIAKGT